MVDVVVKVLYIYAMSHAKRLSFGSRGILHTACLAAILFCFALLTRAQDISGIISGTVTDPTDAVVPGAAIKLTQDSTGATMTFTTDSEGSFAFLSVPAGRYTLSITAQGFKAFARQNTNLTSSERLSLGRIALQLGAASESVTVVSQGAAVQTESGERSAVITSSQMSDLSSLSRSWTSYMLTVPSVFADGGDGTSPSIAGQPASSNSVQLDGIGGDAQNGNPKFRVNLDDIAEMKVIATNPPAEYGFHPGAVIDIVTKSGTQQFHGAGAYYKRHEEFNANNFFNNRVGTPKPQYRYNDYDASIGGPIYIPGRFNSSKQKLFFFFSSENQRNNTPSGNRTYTMPTALERQGDFSQSVTLAGVLIPVIDPTTGKPFPGNVIPASRLDPNTQKLLSLFPLPNFFNTAVSKRNYNYIFQEVQPTPYDKYLGKIDWMASNKLRIMFEDAPFASKTGGYNVGAGFAAWGEIAAGYKTGSKADPTGRITYMISPTMVNEIFFGGHYFYEGVWNSNQAELDKYNRVKAGIDIPYLYPANANANQYHLIPTATFGGITGAAAFSMDSRFPLHNVARRYGASDNLTKQAGSHTLKAGFFWNYTNQNYGSRGTYYGNFDFSNNTNNPLNTGYAYSNAMLGVFNSYTEASSYFPWKVASWGMEWYVQDTWKVNRKLTLNYGMRFSYILPKTNNSNGLGAAFNLGFYDPSQRVQLYQPGTSGGVRVAVNPLTGQTANAVLIGAIVPNYGNPTDGMALDTDPKVPRGDLYNPGVLPGPRFGFAYDPFGNGKTAIRGGIGIQYEVNKTNGDIQPYNPPVQFNPVQYYGTVSSISSGAATLLPSNVTGKDFTGHVPTAYSGSFGIQRDIGWGTILDVAYAGVLGRHILAELPLNNLPYGIRFLPSSQDPTTGKALPDNLLRPIPGYGTITQIEYTGSSNYHSMAVQVSRRFARGLQFGSSWTYGKSLDYGGEYGVYAQYVSRRVWNYGENAYDRKYNLSINWLWELPRVSKLTNEVVLKTILDNWRISGIASFISGAPSAVSFTTTTGADLIGGGDGQRVNLTCNPTLPKSKQTFSQFFNTSCVSMPPVGYMGNSPVTYFHLPGTNNFNMSLFRTFTIKERAIIELRAETYNTFNHTQFTGVNTSATFNPATGAQTNGAFGQFTSAAAARYMQLSGRISF
jgi:hypothetical protein